MSEKFDLVVIGNPAFGALATLSLASQPKRRFTKQESLIVARAIAAVADGVSAERQIFMSPIASDQDFDARVVDGGIVLAAEGAPDVMLDWDEARALAALLRDW